LGFFSVHTIVRCGLRRFWFLSIAYISFRSQSPKSCRLAINNSVSALDRRALSTMGSTPART
jgi:hypothetical protein